MKLWILAAVAIILIITSAAVITMLLLASQNEKQDPSSGIWKIELWNIAKGYRVNLSFQGSVVLGGSNLFPGNAYQDAGQQDITVSRQHCMLYEQDEMLLVWNLSAVNPADLNGHRLNAPQYLSTGDRLKLGHSVFLVTRAEYI